MMRKRVYSTRHLFIKFFLTLTFSSTIYSTSSFSSHQITIMNSSTGNGWVTVGKVKSSKSKKREGKENKNQPKPIEVVPQC